MNCEINETIVPIIDKVIFGKYTRVAFAKKGTLIVGCGHKLSGEAFLLSGKIRQNNDDGTYCDFNAPFHIKTNSGSQRNAFALEDSIYATIHEVKSETTEEAERELFDGVPQITRIRNDYAKLLQEIGMDKEPIMEDCVIEPNDNIYIGKSEIDGVGCFANRYIKKGEIIAISVLDGVRLSTSRYVNHSDIENCIFIDNSKDTVSLVSLVDIEKDSEILVNYRRRLLCQEL